MAKQHESKSETKGESKPSAEDAPVPVTTAEASEMLSAEFNAAISLERIADALERIADRYAPHAKVQSIASGSRGLPQCSKGHSMQPTDDYCQTCERERRSGSSPKPSPGNSAA